MSAARDFASLNARRADGLRKALLARNLKIANLDRFRPVTGLGRQALVVTQQLAAVSAALQAVTTYTTMIITTNVPPPTFTTTPASTPGIPVSDLQSQYQTFSSQWAGMQGTAGEWINTNPNTDEPSILSQLTSVPGTLTGLDPTVQYYLSMLASLPPGSSTYQTDLTSLQNLVNTQSQYVTALATRVSTFGGSMQSQTDTVVAQVTTGAIAEVITAYQSQINTLNANISSLNDQISSDNTKLIVDYGGAGLSSVVTVLGFCALALPPVGIMMIGSGLFGVYQSASDIQALNAQIAADAAQVTTETGVVSADTSEMSNLQAFAGTVQGYTALNATAQQELTVLANMYIELASYLGTMNTDLSSNDISAASAEWTQIMQGATSLAGITLYVWPSNVELLAPSTLAVASTGVFVIANSGNVYFCGTGAPSWQTVSGCALSILATNSAIIKINGAPADGSTSQNSYNTDYTVCRYNSGNNTWTALSTFAASNIATDGTNIYCTQQSDGTASQYVYQYSGSGTSWTTLPALPNSGVPRYLAVTGGALFVATFNQGIVYKYTGSSWTQISATGTIAVSLTGALGYISYLDQYKNCYLYNVQNGQAPGTTGASVIGVAGSSGGAQYQISASQVLSYLRVVNGTPQVTTLQQNVVAMTTNSNTGQPAYCDNKGALYLLAGNPGPDSNSWVQLPALPAS